MALLDGRGHHARDAKAVAAHLWHDLGAGFVEHGQVQGTAVFVAQLEDMADLDTAQNIDRALAVGAGITGHDIAQIGKPRLGVVAAPVEAGEVGAVVVGPHDHVGHVGQRVIGDDLDRGVDRAERAGPGTEMLTDGGFIGHGQGRGDTGQLFGLDGVEHVITAQHEQYGITRLAHHHDRLGGGAFGHLQVLGQAGDRGHAGGVDLFQRGAGCAAGAVAGPGDRGLDIGGIAAFAGHGQLVLARVGQHMKLFGFGPADGPRIRGHHAIIQPHAIENLRVGPAHGLVFMVQAGIVHMERVGVLHDELTRAHQAEARPDLVAELGLDLIDRQRQLLVAAHVAFDVIGDDFFVRGPEAVLTLGPISHAQHERAHGLPAPGFLPQLGGLYRWHENLQRVDGGHLGPDDRLDLAQYPHAQRRPRIQPGTQPTDHAGTQHQLVRDDLGIGRGFLGGGQGQTG